MQKVFQRQNCNRRVETYKIYHSRQCSRYLMSISVSRGPSSQELDPKTSKFASTAWILAPSGGISEIG